MIVQQALLIGSLFFSPIGAHEPVCKTGTLAEEFKRAGYVEICDPFHGSKTYESLYAAFDEFILFLDAYPLWKQKLYTAKERFIRSKERAYYSTDFFGLYDESKRGGRNQISFYYSIHFDAFLRSHYSELIEIPEINRFLEACIEIQTPCGDLFNLAAAELGLENLFASEYGYPPVLFKVVKYLSTYNGTRPHYDGTAFSLFLDSTDNQSLLLSPYHSSFTQGDFSSAVREYPRSPNQNSTLLIPGSLLAEFSIYPTPHLVIQSQQIRYAAIAFAMRPHYHFQKVELTPLPTLNNSF